MIKIIKCTCGWEYEVDPEADGMGWENWLSCPNCDLPYKHLPYSVEIGETKETED